MERLKMASSSNNVRGPNELQKKILNTNLELPSDDEIKEKLKDRERVEDESESDNDSSSDSDVEGSMEKPLWDALFPNDKPYENTTEDLIRLLHRLPLRFSTRQCQLDKDTVECNQKAYAKVKKLFVDEDIDKEIVLLNLDRIRDIINNKIKKRSKTVEFSDCVDKLGNLAL